MKQKIDTIISSDEFSCDSDEDNKQDLQSDKIKNKINVILVSRIEEVISTVYTKKIKFNKISGL